MTPELVIAPAVFGAFVSWGVAFVAFVGFLLLAAALAAWLGSRAGA